MSESLDDQYWARFEKAVSTSQFLMRDVDGVVGRHITLMTNSLVLVTKGIYENWEGSWEENPVKSVSQQQIDVSIATKELQKAYKQFLDMLTLRKIEYAKLYDGQQKLVRPSTSFGWTRAGGKRTFTMTFPNESDAMPGPSKSRTPPYRSPTRSESSPDDYEMIDNAQSFTAPADHCSPTEREIKQEPLDEEDVGYQDELTAFKEEPLDSKANVKKEDLDDLNEVDIKQEPIADMFTADSRGDSRPLYYADAHDEPPLPSVRYVPANRSYIPANGPRMQATAMIAVSGPVRVDRNGMERGQHFLTKQVVDHVPYDPLKEKYADWKDPRMCYLCDKHTNLFYTTPTTEMKRADFLKRIITITQTDIARVASLKNNDRRAYFCLNHVAVREFPASTFCENPSQYDPIETEEDIQLREKLSIPMKFTPSLNRETILVNNIQPPPRIFTPPVRKCDLCMGRAWPFCLSPKDQTLAPAFFANLIGLTPGQHQRADWFISKAHRATICRSHNPTQADINPNGVNAKAQMHNELVMLKNRLERMADGPTKNALKHVYFKKMKQKEEHEEKRRLAQSGSTPNPGNGFRVMRNTQPLTARPTCDAFRRIVSQFQTRAVRRNEVREIEVPEMVAVGSSRRKITYQTVPEECDSIRNLRSIIDSAPSLERESPNEELIKKESQDDPCYSGII